MRLALYTCGAQFENREVVTALEAAKQSSSAWPAQQKDDQLFGLGYLEVARRFDHMSVLSSEERVQVRAWQCALGIDLEDGLIFFAFARCTASVTDRVRSDITVRATCEDQQYPSILSMSRRYVRIWCLQFVLTPLCQALW